MKVRKNCSIGEYDPSTGMTYMTRKKGRLLFQMGTSLGSMRNEMKHKKLNLKTGSFTGLVLYPEEVYYLLLRDVLDLYLHEDISCSAVTIDSMSIKMFVSRLLGSQMRVEFLHAYNFLRMNKLHPRRHVHDESCGHVIQQVASASALQQKQKCPIVYEVRRDRQTETNHKESGGVKSNVEVACRIIVCRFEVSINIRYFKHHPNIPTKVAVCDCEGNILTFDIGKKYNLNKLLF